MCALKFWFGAGFPKERSGAAAPVSQVTASIAVHQDLVTGNLKAKIGERAGAPAQSFANGDVNAG